ncbi:MAG: response regulator [Desulfobacterales bacterium]|nr:response regulator [Desulfobacterales bacterium]
MAHASEKRILVVEDEPDVRSFLAACLEDAGFNVETAVDGVDALEKIDAYTPDLMTLDMVMPRLSGVKVIRKLRTIERWAKLPVIVITAHAHDELGSEEIKGFNAMTSGLRPRITMEKPISPANLIKTICKILDVEVDTGQATDDAMDSERRSIMKLLNETDSATLKRIRAILNT